VTTIKQFADELTAVSFSGVITRFTDIPKALTPGQLPASWVDMPASVLEGASPFSSFSEHGAQHTAAIYIAVAEKVEGYPAEQRTDVLTMAATVEEWARTTDYRQIRLFTGSNITCGMKEYRGVIAQVTADDDL
jgi:hypothetical protein